jgi:hypothetical protein
MERGPDLEIVVQFYDHRFLFAAHTENAQALA